MPVCDLPKPLCIPRLSLCLFQKLCIQLRQLLQYGNLRKPAIPVTHIFIIRSHLLWHRLFSPFHLYRPVQLPELLFQIIKGQMKDIRNVPGRFGILPVIRQLIEQLCQIQKT